MDSQLTPHEQVVPLEQIIVPDERKTEVILESIQLKKGQKLYEIDRISWEVTEAKLVTVKVDDDLRFAVKGKSAKSDRGRKIDIKIRGSGLIFKYEPRPGCSYVAALSRKRAVEKMGWKIHLDEVKKNRWRPPKKDKPGNSGV